MAESMPQFTSVYHSLDSILNFFKTSQFSQVEQVQKLLDIFNQRYKYDLHPRKDHLHPFIVLEGLDGSGKTTAAKRLTKEITGVALSTPPSYLLELRSWFDEQPSDVRRAFYSLGNYLTGQQAETGVESCPIIMDRFWHSTASFAIADQVKEKNIALPPLGDPVYEWPEDLAKPDLVLFLNVNEYHRLQRHSGRNTTNTLEEQELAANAAWRSNVIEAHKRICNVRMEIINANRYPNKVFTNCMQFIKPLC